jgi:hypothetical protein
VNHKQISTDSSPDRNLQFEYLAELRGRFQRRHLPCSAPDRLDSTEGVSWTH